MKLPHFTEKLRILKLQKFSSEGFLSYCLTPEQQKAVKMDGGCTKCRVLTEAGTTEELWLKAR